MRLLMIGDVVGRPGRRACRMEVERLVREFGVDLVIANGENVAGGNGITRETADELFSCGIDVLTMGNHVWDKKEILGFIEHEARLIRPANYPAGTPGVGYVVYRTRESQPVAVVNLSGRVYLANLECPFRTASRILDDIRKYTPVVLVDFHAEATSEKIAMGRYLDGKVSAVCGTHTHVQTADERILPRGTAYISDVGMTGPRDSIIGVKAETVLEKFLTQMPKQFQVAGGPYQFNAVLVTVDQDSGKALNISRIQRYEPAS